MKILTSKEDNNVAGEMAQSLKALVAFKSGMVVHDFNPSTRRQR